MFEAAHEAWWWDVMHRFVIRALYVSAAVAAVALCFVFSWDRLLTVIMLLGFATAQDQARRLRGYAEGLEEKLEKADNMYWFQRGPQS